MLLCVGDIDIDLILRVPRLPGRDEKIGGELVGRAPGGMAANVAVGACRLGTPVRLVGAVGDDAMGAEALGLLGRESVDVSHVATRRNVPTFFCLILLDPSGEKSLVRVQSEAYLPRPDDLTPRAFAGVSHVHMTFTERALAEPTLALARQAGASLSLDLEAADVSDDVDWIRFLVDAVDILFLSDHSRRVVEERVGELGREGDRLIVTTQGASGARLEGPEGEAFVAGHPVMPVDTLGAGDGFAAAFLSARLRTVPVEEALRFANAAGALATRAYGAQAGMASRDEVEAMLACPSDARRRA